MLRDSISTPQPLELVMLTMFNPGFKVNEYSKIPDAALSE
jgi:hypothetical protein